LTTASLVRTTAILLHVAGGEEDEVASATVVEEVPAVAVAALEIEVDAEVVEVLEEDVAEAPTVEDLVTTPARRRPSKATETPPGSDVTSFSSPLRCYTWF
jgi:hypothetical protein